MIRGQLAKLSCAGALLLAGAAAFSQETLEDQAAPDLSGVQEALRDMFDRVWAPRRRYADSPQVRALFRPVVAEAARSIVQVRSGGRQVSLGAVVGPDGWILTKASTLRADEAPRCRLADGEVYKAQVVGIDRVYDLAMLKIDAKELPSLDLTGKPAPTTQPVAVKTGEKEMVSVADPPITTEGWQVGDWVATVGRGRDPIAVGVISAVARTIPARPGFLGVQMSRDQTGVSKGVLINEVLESGGAKDAGVLGGDIIEQVDGEPTNTSEELIEAISGRSPGDAIDLTLRRGGSQIELRAILSARQLNPAQRRALYQNRLGGALSERRFGFPAALQHDTVLAPRDCGGPLVNLDGEVVGFNLARAGRTESYAAPVGEVAARLVDLMSGKLAPTPRGPRGG